MFDLFRSREKSVRIVLGALLGVVALSMLVYLVPGGFGGPSVTGQDTVAVVGDQKITTIDIQRKLDRFTQSQPNIPRSFMSMLVPQAVNSAVEEAAMAYEAKRLGIIVSDDELSDTIQSIFTARYGAKFDPNLYTRAVQTEYNMTVPDYEQALRNELLRMRLDQVESQSIVISDQEAKAEYQRKNEKVGLQYIAFQDKDFTSKVNKDPAAIKGYFDKNRALFRTPEKRDILYIVASTADFMQNVKITDDQLHQAYNDNRESYQIPERVRVRHILIKTQGKPKDQWPALKQKADSILKQLQGGGNFEELAKKDSEDPGSAQKGGELGWLSHGQTVKNFDTAAFSLPVGKLSGVIETEFGYHILQVEEKQTAHTQTFDEVRPQLEADLRKQTALDALKKAIDQAHLDIKNKPSQAAAIAKKYNLRTFTLNGFESNGLLPDVNTPQEVNAVFTTPKMGVTDIVNQDAEGKEAFAVVDDIHPSHNAEFNEVQADVQQKYVEAEATRLAQAAAADAAARAKKGEALETIAKGYGLQVKTAAPFTAEGAAEGIGSGSLLAAAFKANVGDIVGPVAAQAGQFVCKVSEKVPADMSQFAKNRDAIVQSLQQNRQQLQGELFRDSLIQHLKKAGKIKMNADTIERMQKNYQS